MPVVVIDTFHSDRFLNSLLCMQSGKRGGTLVKSNHSYDNIWIPRGFQANIHQVAATCTTRSLFGSRYRYLTPVRLYALRFYAHHAVTLSLNTHDILATYSLLCASNGGTHLLCL